MNVIVVGMGYGDEGKGTITEFLCEHIKADIVIKYNGGCQSAHNVYDKIHHCFSQFGAGTMLGVRTHIDHNFIVSIRELFNEANHLKYYGYKSYELLTIDPYAPVSTAIDKMINKIRRKGNTCGMGIGETRQRNIDGVSFDVGDAVNGNFDQLRKVYDYYKQFTSYTQLGEEMANLAWNIDIHTFKTEQTENIILSESPEFTNAVFEGGQGVLLDQDHGEKDYNTWSNTTSQHAEEFCRERNLKYEICGVIRSYHTRHGDGPFPDADFSYEDDNVLNDYQGKFRFADFNEALWQKATKIQPVDYIATTCNDQRQSILTARIKSWGKRRTDKEVHDSFV